MTVDIGGGAKDVVTRHFRHGCVERVLGGWDRRKSHMRLWTVPRGSDLQLFSKTFRARCSQLFFSYLLQLLSHGRPVPIFFRQSFRIRQLPSVPQPIHRNSKIFRGYTKFLCVLGAARRLLLRGLLFRENVMRGGKTCRSPTGQVAGRHGRQ